MAELVCVPCADLGLTRQPREEHAAYIANWLDVLTADNHAIVTAASHAQRAADFINGLQPAASARLPADRGIRVAVSVLLTFCRWSLTSLLQTICRRVVARQRLIYCKGRSTF